MAFAFLLENGTDRLLLEDGSSRLVQQPVWLVGTASGSTIDETGNWTVSLSGISVAQGDVIVVSTGAGTQGALGGPTTLGVSGNNSGAYTGAGAQVSADDTEDADFRLFYKVQGATPDTTITCSGTPKYTAGATAQVWRGVDTTTPIDVTGTPASTINTARGNPPSVTPTTADAIIIAGGFGTQKNPASAFTPPAGMDIGQVSIVMTNGLGHYGGSWIAAAEWTSGAYDPPAWTGGGDDTLQSAGAQTIALRALSSRQALTPSLFTNSQTFHAATVTASYTLEAPLLTNDQTFYGPTVTASYTITPSLFTNTSVIYAPTVFEPYLVERWSIVAPAPPVEEWTLRAI